MYYCAVVFTSEIGCDTRALFLILILFFFQPRCRAELHVGVQMATLAMGKSTHTHFYIYSTTRVNCSFSYILTNTMLLRSCTVNQQTHRRFLSLFCPLLFFVFISPAYFFISSRLVPLARRFTLFAALSLSISIFPSVVSC